METLIAGFVIMVAGFVSGHRVLRRTRSRLAAAQMKLLPAPAQDVASEFEALGFLWWNKPGCKDARARYKDVIFTVRTAGCTDCGGTVYVLGDCFAGDTGSDLVCHFGYACVRCRALVRRPNEWPLSDQVHAAWSSATDLSDFLERMKRARELPKDSPAQRQAQLKRQLADLEAQRCHLRSQLLSAENQLGEPSDEEPYR